MGPKRNQPQPPPESESDHSEEQSEDMGGWGPNLDPDYSKKFLAKLQPEVRQRVAVLQTQDKALEALDAAHDKAVVNLRRKYAELMKPIFAKRREIVTGAREPTDEEVKAGFPKEHDGQVKLTDDGEKPSEEEKGISNFWLQALSHHVIIDGMISERDHDALEFLEDITYDMLAEPHAGFTLTFHFKPDNGFFSDTTLSKTFFLKELDDEFVLDHAVGTEIHWLPGKNLGVQIEQKKQKNKKGQVRYINKEVPCPTFFDFFKEKAEEDEDEQNHAMAETIKDKIIPFAVEYFTGEAPTGDSDIDGDDEEGEEDEDDEDEDDDEDDEPPAPAPRGRGGRGAGAPAGSRGKAPPPDCKQQ